MGSDEFAKVVFMLDHYSVNLWSEFFLSHPKMATKIKNEKVGESRLGRNLLILKKKNLDPSKFSSMLHELVLSDLTDLRQKIDFIYKTRK